MGRYKLGDIGAASLHDVENLAYNAPDPAFNEFLKAGFARVRLPVRPGFEPTIHGDIWLGQGLPPIGSPLYFAIQQEIADSLK